MENTQWFLVVPVGPPQVHLGWQKCNSWEWVTVHQLSFESGIQWMLVRGEPGVDYSLWGWQVKAPNLLQSPGPQWIPPPPPPLLPCHVWSRVPSWLFWLATGPDIAGARVPSMQIPQPSGDYRCFPELDPTVRIGTELSEGCSGG